MGKSAYIDMVKMEAKEKIKMDETQIDEIRINEKTTKQLIDINNKIQTLNSYMEIIASTLINANNKSGIYFFSPDFTKLIQEKKESN